MTSYHLQIATVNLIALMVKEIRLNGWAELAGHYQIPYQLFRWPKRIR
jgi:hypothetical protein